MTALVIIIFNGNNSVFEYGGIGGVVMIDGLPAEVLDYCSCIFRIHFIFRSFSNHSCSIVRNLNNDFMVILWFTIMDVYFGKSKVSELTYKSIFLIFIVIGAAGDMSSVWAFSDAMILALVFPNMIGLLILFPRVRDELNSYLNSIKALKIKN